MFQIVFIPLIGISGCVTISAFYLLKNKITYLIFKGITTLLILLFCAASFFIYNNDGMNYTLFITLIAVGLLFSLAGDITIFFKKNTFFLIALMCFICTHCIYAACFILFSDFSLIDIGTGIIIWSFCLILYLYFSRHLGKLKIPVVIYMIIITFMVWRAFSTLFSERITLVQGIFISTGSVLFYVSDIFLAMNMFVKPVKRFHLKNLTLYYLGQLFIALSCYYFVV